ncbi:MAG: hypothetical protein HON14_13640 [Rhodospirillaceae bacterium]|jgi:thioredoxin-related protein|nr:hypothetical protein [Rhodospirillaceae bacterium]MBT4940171.1 hypothetical protein [Rhodospirillaceae bacterium]MBT5939399.1 hypothetical protein [Rhodospirillaceae bacterium]MBT7268826.1 hypothetical protein [Rhodospirillaceae bacterium]
MRCFRFSLFILLLALFAGGVSAKASSAELIMFESENCEWCEVWLEKIGPIYPKTPEGKYAPLRRVDIADEMPKDLAKLRPASFTPTFVVMENGVEITRILGYPGEDFFWGLLEEALKKIGYRPES